MTTRSYAIRVKGVAGPGTIAAFSDLELSTEHDCTILYARSADQAALHGLLNRILDLGLELIEVAPDESAPGGG